MSERSPKADLAHRTAIVAGIVFAMGLAFAVFYVAAPAFFILFAALVVAAVLDGAARGLAMLGLRRPLAMILVFLFVISTVGGLIFLSGATLVSQAGQLLEALREQANALLERLGELGLPFDIEEMDAAELRQLMPEPEGVVSGASTALFSAIGWVGNFFIILFLAAFIAWQPGLYRRGLVSLIPRPKRPRFAETVDAGAHSLRMWLLGEAISMTTVFAVSWVALWLIDMPFAFLLALQAGLLAFVPTLGALIAGIPIVLTGLSVDFTTALLGLGVYILIQGVESNITTPLAQRWATSLPPALTLTVQLVAGLLFGLWGFVLAVPMVAVVMVFVQKLYIEDTLGGPFDDRPADERSG